MSTIQHTKQTVGHRRRAEYPIITREGNTIMIAFSPLSRSGSRSSDWELIAAVQAGLPARLVREMADVLALPHGVMDTIVSKRTLERREKDGQPLTPEQSDRLVRTLRIISRAVETFGDRDAAIEWMTTPNAAMEGRAPISLIDTDPGVKLVERILIRIDHGVFS